MSVQAQQGLSSGLAKKLAMLEEQRDSCVRLLERTERGDLRAGYLRSIAQLTEQIESHQQALEYNAWLDDSSCRGPWVEVVVADGEEPDPMDAVHIEIVDGDPEESGVELEIVSVGERVRTKKEGPAPRVAGP